MEAAAVACAVFWGVNTAVPLEFEVGIEGLSFPPPAKFAETRIARIWIVSLVLTDPDCR
jgi:hypothetical protein